MLAIRHLVSELIFLACYYFCTHKYGDNTINITFIKACACACVCLCVCACARLCVGVCWYMYVYIISRV